MRRKLFFFVVIQIFLVKTVDSQSFDTVVSGRDFRCCKVAFWNLENFFDYFVDTTRVYNDYTPEGVQRWTMKRFYAKRNNIYKVLLSLYVCDDTPLGLIGLAEVENDFVLHQLFVDSPLRRLKMKYIHYESPDRRGIDCALVYNPLMFRLVTSRPIPLIDPENVSFRSRDILYAKFIMIPEGESSVQNIATCDTVHVFVNHWPSRYGGEAETVRLRSLAALKVRSTVDSISQSLHTQPKIIIMGDLNDTPEDPSLNNTLKAKSAYYHPQKNEQNILINLFKDNKTLGFQGTLKHQYNWQIFDHIIISQTLRDEPKQGRVAYINESARIFAPSFVLVDDKTYGGEKLYRTFLGPKYIGGFSDHLLVFMKIKF